MKPFRNIFIVGISALAFCACSSDDTELEELAPQELTDIRVIAPDFIFEPSARMVINFTGSGFRAQWELGDTLGILPNAGDQVSFPIVNIDPNKPNSASFTGGGWALRQSSSYAAYYPYIGDIHLDKKNIQIDYSGQWQKANNDLLHMGDYAYMAAVGQVPDQGLVTFNLQHLGCYTIFDIMTPEPTAFSSITFCADEKLFVERAKFDMSSPAIAAEPVVLTDSLCFSLEGVETTADNLKMRLFFMFAPTTLAGKNFKAVLRDSHGYEEEVEIVGKDLVAGHGYLFKDLQYVTYTKATAPKWTFDGASSAFQAGMTAVVTVPSSMRHLMGEGDELAAFIGGELRGVGKRIGDAYYLVVHGNIGESGRVTFQYFNQKKEYLYEAKDVVDFNSDNVYGTADHPQELPLKVVK